MVPPTDAPSAALFAAAGRGDDGAAAALHARFAGRARRLAGARLPRRLAGRADADDLAQDAWHSLFLAAAAGRVTLTKPGDAWRVLATIVVRKAGRLARRHDAGKRDVTRERGGVEVAGAVPAASAVLRAGELACDLLAELPAASRPAGRLLAAGFDADAAAGAAGRTPRTARRDAARLRAAAVRRLGPPELPATLDDGDFLLTRHLAAGGTGKVYRATHRPSGDAVAVKFLRKAFWKDVPAARRFRRGCAAAAYLNDPGVVRVRGLGRTPAGGWFAALDLVDGPDLHRVLTDRGPLPVEEAVTLAAAVAETLARCHAAGVVHGDVKPANVLLGPTDGPLLTDFAPPAGTDEDEPAAFGTLAFCAPEQADPRRPRCAEAADAWGAGALLFALLTGRPPRDGGSPAVLLARAARGEPAPPVRTLRPDVPAAVATLCAGALSVDPESRPTVRAWAERSRNAM